MDGIYKVKDWPTQERPRERLINKGAASLSDSELIAIILRTGSSNENVVDLSKRILKKFSLQELSQASLSQIIQFNGISNAKACQILACFELAKRVFSGVNPQKICIESSKDVAMIICPELRFLKKEQFIGIYLDSRNCLIKKDIISIGGLNTSIVHPRELFKVAIQESANSVIIAHNHPSGNPKPSNDDILITKKIINAGKIIGIPVLDHIVVGENNYVSMAEQNLAKF